MMQVIGSPKAFRINFKDIFGTGRARCEPSVFSDNLDPADRRMIPRRVGENILYLFTGQVRGVNLLWRKFSQQPFLLPGGGRIDAFNDRMAKFPFELAVYFAGIPTHALIAARG